MAKRKSAKEQTTIYKHTHKTKDRVTLTPLKTRGEHCICMREMNLVFDNNYIVEEM